jgi:chromosome segregation ATPase
VQRPQVNNPAQQLAEAQAILANLKQPAEQPQEDEKARALKAKDDAIADLRSQNEQLQAAQQSLTAEMQKLVGELQRQNAPAPVAAPELPGLPENINDLPADEQLRVTVDAFQKLRAELDNRLHQNSDQLRQFLSPLGGQMKKMSEWQEEKQITETYPNFPYGEQKKEMDALRAEFKGMMTGIEAAQQIAAKTGNLDWLQQPEPSAPVVEASRPSVEAVSGPAPTIQNPQSEQWAQGISQLNEVARQAHLQGRGNLANSIVDEVLRQKLFKKG